MKQSRKPKTPSIKQIMADNNIRGMQQIMSDSTIRDRIDHSNCLFNTFTDKDGTTYRWKAGTIPTEEDIVQPGDIHPRTDSPPNPMDILEEYGKRREEDTPPTDNILPYGDGYITREELEVREKYSPSPTLIRDTPEWNEAVRNIDSHKTPISMTLTKEEAHHLTQHGQLTLSDLVQRMHGKRLDTPPSPPTPWTDNEVTGY
jgi:hypothetical protein